MLSHHLTGQGLIWLGLGLLLLLGMATHGAGWLEALVVAAVAVAVLRLSEFLRRRLWPEPPIEVEAGSGDRWRFDTEDGTVRITGPSPWPARRAARRCGIPTCGGRRAYAPSRRRKWSSSASPAPGRQVGEGDSRKGSRTRPCIWQSGGKGQGGADGPAHMRARLGRAIRGHRATPSGAGVMAR